MVAKRPLLMDQLNQICLESFFMPQETEMEGIRASLAGMTSIFQLTKVVEEKSHELKNLKENVGLLIQEKNILVRY